MKRRRENRTVKQGLVKICNKYFHKSIMSMMYISWMSNELCFKNILILHLLRF